MIGLKLLQFSGHQRLASDFVAELFGMSIKENNRGTNANIALYIIEQVKVNPNGLLVSHVRVMKIEPLDS